jgi:hypothetical protein
VNLNTETRLDTCKHLKNLIIVNGVSVFFLEERVRYLITKYAGILCCKIIGELGEREREKWTVFSEKWHVMSSLK